MKIGDTFKKFVDTTAEIEARLGNPTACFIEEQEREEKERKHHKKAKSNKTDDN